MRYKSLNQIHSDEWYTSLADVEAEYYIEEVSRFVGRSVEEVAKVLDIVKSTDGLYKRKACIVKELLRNR